jgi:hypothetical protein
LLGQAALVELATPGSKGKAESTLLKLLEGSESQTGSEGDARQRELTSATIHVLLSLFISLLNQKNTAHARTLLTLLAKSFLDDSTRKRMGGEGKAALVWGVGVWVVGTKEGGEESWLPDLTRITVKDVVDAWEIEEDAVSDPRPLLFCADYGIKKKDARDLVHLQLTVLAVKLLVSVDFSPVKAELLQPRQTLKTLCSYVLTLAKQSSSVQVRDRARFLVTLAGGVVDFNWDESPASEIKDDDQAWGAVPTEDDWQRRIQERTTPLSSSASRGMVKLRKEQIKVILGEGYQYGGAVRTEALAKTSDSIYAGPLWGTLSAVLEKDMTTAANSGDSLSGNVWEGGDGDGWANGSSRWPDWCEVPSGREDRDKVSDRTVGSSSLKRLPQTTGAASLKPTPTSFGSGTVAARIAPRGSGNNSGQLTPVHSETLANPSPSGSFIASRFKDMDLDEFYAEEPEDEEPVIGAKSEEESEEESEEGDEESGEEEQSEESEEENSELQGFYN